MTRHIDPETLRKRLDAHEPVTVVDIRTDDDYAQWAIPGSVHVNAYEALRNGQPRALAELSLPGDRPVVTVCNAGQVSQTAADLLATRGFDARSLAGGMNAWSLAWNAADVRVPHPSVQVIQARRTGKGCLSYVAGQRVQPRGHRPVGRTRRLPRNRPAAWMVDPARDRHPHPRGSLVARRRSLRAGNDDDERAFYEAPHCHREDEDRSWSQDWLNAWGEHVRRGTMLRPIDCIAIALRTMDS